MSPPLRILFVVDGYYPSNGGAEHQVQLLSSTFAKMGHTVNVITPRLDVTKPINDTVDGVVVERIIYPKIPLLGAIILCIRYALKLISKYRNYDAIHIHMAKNLAAATGFVRPLLRASMIVKISGAWEFEGGILDPAKKNHLLYKMLNTGIRQADYVQCLSQFTWKKLIEAGYPTNLLRMIPNAVDISRFETKLHTEDKLSGSKKVVYVGRLRRVKGLTVLLEAWAKLNHHQNTRLIIAGDGDLRNELLENIQRLKISNSVELLGEISDIPGLLRDAYVYVQPSFQEGMPNSVLEAMAAGLPIVATEVSGNEDLVRPNDNGLLVPAGDSDTLAAAIQQLLDNPVQANQMGIRSYQYAIKHYGLASVIEQLTRAYRREL